MSWFNGQDKKVLEQIGSLSGLQTTAKTSLVAAINEVKQTGGSGGQSVSIVDNLTSTSATSALSAAQGKTLQDNKVDKTHTHSLDDLSDVNLTGATDWVALN